MENIFNHFEEGNIHLQETTVESTINLWKEHPSFKGVFLKLLLSGSQTNGLFSTHLVKIMPHHVLNEHIHDGKTELHEVVKGTGTCYLAGREISYKPGDCAVIPQGAPHKVIAGDKGLYLFAKFFPALV
jgi:mannose-6-phosphate isomerase-like protein (cupin superfamily)